MRHDATVEAAVARGAGLHVRDHVQMARNASVWAASLAGAASAVLAPSALSGSPDLWTVAGGLAVVGAALFARRGWMLQRSLRELDAADDPAITEGDEELADIDRQLSDLIHAVAHLASSSDQSRAAAVVQVRDAADSVKALAQGFDEVTRQQRG